MSLRKKLKQLEQENERLKQQNQQLRSFNDTLSRELVPFHCEPHYPNVITIGAKAECHPKELENIYMTEQIKWVVLSELLNQIRQYVLFDTYFDIPTGHVVTEGRVKVAKPD